MLVGNAAIRDFSEDERGHNTRVEYVLWSYVVGLEGDGMTWRLNHLVEGTTASES